MKCAMLLLVLSISSPAFAGDNVIAVDMTKPIFGPNGKTPIKDMFEATREDQDCAKCSILTVGAAISHALNGDVRDARAQPLSGDQRWAQSILADRIRNSPKAQLELKEAKTIEDQVLASTYNGFVIKQIIPLIDPSRKVPQLP